MTDPLLRYYEQELAFVRRSLGLFSSEYPEHARSLNLNQGKIEDPSIARLLDGVALLNATIEKQLSEQLPDVVEGLLGVLYPSYTQLVPSIAYLQPTTSDIPQESVTLPENSRFSGSANGKEYQFTTVAPITIEPYQLTDVQALSAPFGFNRPNHAAQTTAVIQLTLSTGDPDVHFRHLDLKDLDFFVQGFESSADSLVDILLSDVAAISVSDSQCETHIAVDRDNLVNRISDPTFSFLPQHGNQFSGYQLMSEFFFFKEKRQFFRLKQFGLYATQLASSDIKINLFLHSLPSEFVRLFEPGVFKLNVIPAANLFYQMGEPAIYDHRKLTIPVNADAHPQSGIQVVDVLDVFEITPSGERPLVPLFRNKYGQLNHTDSWQSKRDINGDFHLAISLPEPHNGEFNKTYGTHLLCTNGKYACSIHSSLECMESIDLPVEFAPIYPPSAPLARERDPNSHWQFIGLLNGNFSSLLQSTRPADDLKQMLTLCSRPQVSASEIQTIRRVVFHTQVSAIRTMGSNVFAPGTEIEITLDTDKPFHAFCDVLNHFFQQFCSFDRYIQLKIRLYGHDGVVKTYPKVHGSQLCL
ncbi:type VI secretion system baseplate subunit TssF [Vibrio sp. V39_P1S14PM300]|uniref:type VI secretion system baseplate subunit TssF n=1 Tax=Vibrio sp. V39_P1S14PM300 TaxID=1938690 RepID=UPI0013724CDE|nr:type VI secretion system baseplate subunit TssF [Vibrio sp. V39_P1S14PM300]NAX22320.1 type VI secretion system baseplate subunit TssF [Vibrio sp. V39_P1S14PM300]